MSNDRNIFNWFGRKEEKEVLEKAKTHIEKVCETVSVFHDYAIAFLNGKTEEAAALAPVIRQKEHEADRIRQAIFDDLSGGMLLPAHREDLTHMIEFMDDIADWANDAGKLFTVVDEKIPEDISKKLISLIETTLICVMKTKDAVLAMTKNPKDVLALCNDVEHLEEECDDIEKDAFMITLHNKKLSPSMLLLLHDIIASIETISDKAEDTADILRVLALKK